MILKPTPEKPEQVQ